MDLDGLATALGASRGIQHKRDISGVLETLLPGSEATAVRVGDDCAAIPDGDGWLLLAIEGFLNEFVAQEPWFAGYCGVMVNVSDIYAMGGRPMAVVDALWSRDLPHAAPVVAGIAAASRAYGVPVVGGHSNARNDREQLSVAILGRANALLTSFDARDDDVLVVAIDLRGAYHEPTSNWDASTGTDGTRLRADLEVLPLLAESGLCTAAKDISMAGVLGTLLMMLECSGKGAVVDVSAVPRPAGVPLHRWLLSTFPSFGFVLAVAPVHVESVVQAFRARAIACSPVGHVDASRRLRLRDGSSAGTQECIAWDFDDQVLTGCTPAVLPSGILGAVHA